MKNQTTIIYHSNDPDGIDFLVGYHYAGGMWKVSLRECGNDVDLSQIATSFGGGGHAEAAGFYVSDWNELVNIIDL
jgi:nanoRNase/pAp phosphatase (c-di-AMP/oligoRNAs hydrolase)